MLGAFPCSPGFGHIEEFKNKYFYCSSCQGIVSPKKVSIPIINAQQQEVGNLSILRCKEHSQGISTLSTLRGLLPNSSCTALMHRMERLRLCVQTSDWITCLSYSLSAISIGLGIINALLLVQSIASITFVLLCLGLVLGLLGIMSQRVSEKNTRSWFILSQEYIKRSKLIPIQKDTDQYVMLTRMPPTCCALTTVHPFLMSPV